MNSSEVYSSILEFQNPKSRIGIWDGEVVSIHDPTKFGLVQVRVFLIHGDEIDTPDGALPWAEVNYWGGGYDWGEFDPPPVGTKVHVIFKHGDETQPVIVGAVRGCPIQPQKIRSKITSDSEPIWVTPANEDETPKDLFPENEDFPYRKIWRKSFKGHTIIIGEKDEEEFLKILDRSGQVIEFSCPVKIEENISVTGQRGTSDASVDSQFEQSRLVDNRGYIRICDVAGQEVLLDGRSGNERILIKNRNRSGSRMQFIEMVNRSGSEHIKIQDQAGNRCELHANESLGTSILLEDQRGSKITFDSVSGQIILNPKVQSIEIVPQDKNVTVDGSLNEEIAGSKNISILNNLDVSVAGCKNEGILGDINHNVGGRIGLTVGNVSPSGESPSTTRDAWSVVTPLGSFKLHTLSGKIVILNCADPTLTSLNTGGGLIIDPTGESVLECMDLAKFIAAPGGICTVDASTAIKLGGVGAADFLLKGNTVWTDLKIFFEAVNAAASGAPGPAAVNWQSVGLACKAILATMSTWLSTKVTTE